MKALALLTIGYGAALWVMAAVLVGRIAFWRTDSSAFLDRAVEPDDQHEE